MGGSGRERRSEPRAGAAFDIRLGTGERAAGRLKNLSRSGLCCVVPTPWPEFSVARASFSLPTPAGLRTIDLDGAVVRCRPEPGGGYEVALFFQFLPAETRGLLAAYVAEHPPS